MKKSELTKFLREEIKNVINEENAAAKAKNLPMLKTLVGKKIKGVNIGNKGVAELYFEDGSKVTFWSRTYDRDKDPNIELG